MAPMDVTAQPELFGGLFADYEGERRRTVRARLLQLTELHGPMVPQSIIPIYLDLSKQRVSQLILGDRLPVFQVGGKNWIPMVAIELFRDEERKSGRHIKELSLREAYSKVLPAHWDNLKKSFRKRS